MFLRSLTIKGFKSFARKTVLEFEPGVTIIVGPNGSGKSNIADAVMWVLGEQSPTSLRGNRMEDVIFSGSSSLKPVNLAEVTLTLDNSNNDFPLDYSEVHVTRNVVRGSDSEYRLNNNSCRLLDIQELLSDAGVGRTLNSVISQGQLDDVLSCRPEERRDYIEEAGGLLKYRKRREKAVRRLERMEEELLRTNDVAREVRRQLRPLQRQAGRLEQYTGLVKELRESRLKLDVARLRAMRREWDEHSRNQEDREKRLVALDGAMREKGAGASELERAQAEWRGKESSLRAGLYGLVSLHEGLKATLGVWEQKARLAREPGRRAFDPKELERLAAGNAVLEAERARVLAARDEAAARESELAGRAEELNVTLNELARRRAALETRLEVLRTSAGGESDLSAERLARKRESLENLRAARETAVQNAEAAAAAAARASAEARELDARADELQAALAAVSIQMREAEATKAGLSATLEILTRLDTRTWSPANSAAALSGSDPTGGGLGGMLVESLKIEEGYETAVNSYLGPWLYGIIARDTNAIIVAIEHLKKAGLGRGLFFRHGIGAAFDEGHGPQVEGAARARDLVRAPDWFDDALDTLLDGVYVAADLDSAVELAGIYPHLVFLTPDGDEITGGSLVKGGSSEVDPMALELSAGRRRRMEESLASALASMDSLALNEKALADEAASVKASSAAAREALAAAREDLEAARSAAASLEATIAALESDLAEAASGAESEAAGLHPEELASRISEVTAEEREAADDMARTRAQRREVAERLVELAAELAAVDRNLEIGRIHMRDLEARAKGEPGAARRSEADTEDIARLAALQQRMEDLLRVAREKAKAALDEGVAGEKKAAESLRALRESLASMQADHEALRDQVHAEELSSAELKVRVEQLVERIVDEHKVPLDFAVKQYPDAEPTPELESKVAGLAAELERIGPVNPEAIAEREALEERFNFLKTQMDDIDKARSQLRRVIKEVDREIEEKFSETLGAVNYHFKEIFRTLFPNGSAELRLTDPEDLLGSGVEIMAQPEGKRLRRISLLSGGETSMTALAFFFALFKVRPSPFYFLDEVEAALDDVNLHRFLDLVREFKGESQLILITHQKRSMEIADLLYGITMQDDGMSRVVSQRVGQPA